MEFRSDVRELAMSQFVHILVLLCAIIATMTWLFYQPIAMRFLERIGLWLIVCLLIITCILWQRYRAWSRAKQESVIVKGNEVIIRKAGDCYGFNVTEISNVQVSYKESIVDEILVTLKDGQQHALKNYFDIERLAYELKKIVRCS